MSEVTTVRFGQQQRVFVQTLRQRVDAYFKTNEISKNGNASMVIKTIAMFAIYFTPYFLMLFGHFESTWVYALLAITMGIGMAGIGLSVMHDANHGSYSKRPSINNIMAYSINIVGGHQINWQLQHNVLHHTYTNIDGHDEDIDAPAFLRFSPHMPLKKLHRFQFVYAWFFYGLMTVMWSTTKDFAQLIRYKKMDLLKTKNKKFGKELTTLIISKILFYIFSIVIPMIVIDLPWYKIAAGIFIVHFTAGLVLALIFQSAHIIEETQFPLPDSTGNIENDWAVHQLYTTANFAPKSKLLSWYAGGLNYQVEHHLFPSICHVHYRKISKIVQETAKEFNFPYHSKPTLVSAVWSHSKMLWKLGRA